jgi:hypothetical protein
MIVADNGVNTHHRTSIEIVKQIGFRVCFGDVKPLLHIYIAFSGGKFPHAILIFCRQIVWFCDIVQLAHAKCTGDMLAMVILHMGAARSKRTAEQFEVMLLPAS